MPKKTLEDFDLKGKRVLIRVDFNVPMDDHGRITDDSRITKSLPTIEFAQKKGARVVLMSHLGRPDGKPDPQYSLRPVAEHLSGLLKMPVKFIEPSIGPPAEEQVNPLRDGEIALLENLRFHSEEEKNDPNFAKALAQLGDLYVNDAFGTAHRAHASTEGIARLLPSAAGFLLAKEIEYFEKVMRSPERPFVVILGGAKVSDKIKIVSNLLDRADTILIGGAMAYPFAKVLGQEIANSKLEAGGEPLARQILDSAKKKGVKIVLPEDRVVADKPEKNVPIEVVGVNVPPGKTGLDVGPRTVELFIRELSKAKTVLWNGPLGVFEVPPFDEGTKRVAQFLATLKATTLIGGGDTAAAINALGLEGKMSHVSTGGGASLEYLEGKVLPGIAALPDKKNHSKEGTLCV